MMNPSSVAILFKKITKPKSIDTSSVTITQYFRFKTWEDIQRYPSPLLNIYKFSFSLKFY